MNSASSSALPWRRCWQPRWGGQQAYDQIRKAEKKGVDLLGEDHVFLNLFRLRFSGYLRKINRLDEAREICQQGIRSIRKSLGENSIFLTQAYGSLGSVEYAANRNEQAADAFREAIRIYQADREKRGPEKYARLQAECHQKLGRSLNLLKAFADADKAFRSAVVLRRKYTEGESTIAPAGLVVALLSTGEKAVSQGEISRISSRGKPAKAIPIAKIWIRAAAKLETGVSSPSEDDRIVIDSLRLGAISIIAQAIKDGFNDRQKLLADPDLKTLQDHKDFQRLLNRTRTRKTRRK